MGRKRTTLTHVITAVSAALLVGCSGEVPVTYDDVSAGDVLRVQVGGEGYRDVLQFVVDRKLAGDIELELTEAGDSTNSAVSEGSSDLAFYQTQPAFLGQQETISLDSLSIASLVDVAPYGLYSSKWADLNTTEDWVNSDLADDSVNGQSLPHGSIVALPATQSGYARALYLLQTVDLVKLDRPFGGITVADLSVSQANVLESQRHLNLRGLDFTGYAEDIYANYDAVILDSITAVDIGLSPARDALAIEPGPDNPYARVLVAPARLAGDPRVSALAHALEGPEVAEYLASTYQGKFISAHVPFPT